MSARGDSVCRKRKSGIVVLESKWTVQFCNSDPLVKKIGMLLNSAVRKPFEIAFHF